MNWNCGKLIVIVIQLSSLGYDAAHINGIEAHPHIISKRSCDANNPTDCCTGGFCTQWCDYFPCDWGCWSDCTVTCGGGTRYRRRDYCKCTHPILSCDFSNKQRPSTSELQSCGKVCFNGGVYNEVDNRCVCANGFYGSCCSSECSSGHYGNGAGGCTPCPGNCRYDSPCDITDGSCPAGQCAAGYYGNKCDIECQPLRFGENCEGICSGKCKSGASCNAVDGSCPNGCEIGYTGSKCDSECTPGYYGEDCIYTCTTHQCAVGSVCDKVTGYCPEGCVNGWTGTSCDQECSPGNYGNGAGSCIPCPGHCRHDTTCDVTDGSCPGSLCAAGYYGDKCDVECEPLRFGVNCESTCSGKCKLGISCNSVDGSCPNGCIAGYKGTMCGTECTPGYYGEACIYNCTTHHCAVGSVCDKVTGYCPQGCADWWIGTSCDQECSPGNYIDGAGSCIPCPGHCRYGTPCVFTDGSCQAGLCAAGYYGYKCDIECNPPSYGENCGRTCSGNCKLNTTCSYVDGRCPNGCISGYSGSGCDTECTPGYYGENCPYTCTTHHCAVGSVCDKVTGYCPQGCADGWTGTSCDQGCLEGTYGPDCIHECACSNSTRCDSITGFCNQVGGTDMPSTRSTETGNSSGSLATWVGVGVGIAVFLLLLAIFTFIMKTRRANIAQNPDEKGTEYNNEACEYDNISDKISVYDEIPCDDGKKEKGLFVLDAGYLKTADVGECLDKDAKANGYLTPQDIPRYSELPTIQNLQTGKGLAILDAGYLKTGDVGQRLDKDVGEDFAAQECPQYTKSPAIENPLYE